MKIHFVDDATAALRRRGYGKDEAVDTHVAHLGSFAMPATVIRHYECSFGASLLDDSSKTCASISL